MPESLEVRLHEILVNFCNNEVARAFVQLGTQQSEKFRWRDEDQSVIRSLVSAVIEMSRNFPGKRSRFSILRIGRLLHPVASLTVTIEGPAGPVAGERCIVQSGFRMTERGDFLERSADPGPGKYFGAGTLRDDNPDCVHLILLNEIQVEHQR